LSAATLAEPDCTVAPVLLLAVLPSPPAPPSPLAPVSSSKLRALEAALGDPKEKLSRDGANVTRSPLQGVMGGVSPSKSLRSFAPGQWFSSHAMSHVAVTASASIWLLLLTIKHLLLAQASRCCQRIALRW